MSWVRIPLGTLKGLLFRRPFMFIGETGDVILSSGVHFSGIQTTSIFRIPLIIKDYHIQNVVRTPNNGGPNDKPRNYIILSHELQHLLTNGLECYIFLIKVRDRKCDP